MAKKNSHISNASVRRLKEQKKQAARKEYFLTHKKQVITGAGIAVAAILLIVLAAEFLFAPAGSLPMVMGKLMGVEETSIVRRSTENKDLYYELGNMEKPEGFEVADFGITSSAPTQEQYRYFVSSDEASVIQNVFAYGVVNKTAMEMLDNAGASLNTTYLGEINNAEIAGYNVHYLYYHNAADEGEAENSATLLLYVDTLQNSCVTLQLTTGNMASADLPTEEALLELAPNILSCLTLPNK